MTKRLTDEQQRHINAAVKKLNPPADNWDGALKNATRQVRPWKSAAIPWDRDTVKDDLLSGAKKLEAAKIELRNRYHWEAEFLMDEERLSDGIDVEDDWALWRAIDVHDREIKARRQAAEKLPSRRRGAKVKAEKDRIWRHTVEQFDLYRPNAPKKDKLAYADLLYLAITADNSDQDWKTPVRKFNKRRRQTAA